MALLLTVLKSVDHDYGAADFIGWHRRLIVGWTPLELGLQSVGVDFLVGLARAEHWILIGLDRRQ